MFPISVATFLPISAPKPVNTPPSGNQTAESADAPMATPPATPKSNIEFLTTDLPKSPNDGPEMPDTVGEPKVVLRTIPYGLLYYFILFF